MTLSIDSSAKKWISIFQHEMVVNSSTGIPINITVINLHRQLAPHVCPSGMGQSILGLGLKFV